MVYTLKINVECNDIDQSYDDTLSFNSPSDKQSIISYLYEKHFHVKYRELGWWLEDGAWDFVKDVEDKWLHNLLDEREITEDPDYLNHYLTYHFDDLKEKIEEKIAESIRSDLMFMSSHELKELDEDCAGEILVYYNIENFSDHEFEMTVPIPDYDYFEDEDTEEDGN